STSSFRVFDKLAVFNLLVAAAIAVPAGVVITVLGNMVLGILSHGHMSAPLSLFALMSVLMVVQTLWNTAGAFLLALNLQHHFSTLYAILSVAAFLCCGVVAHYAGLSAVSILLLISELIISFVVFRTWLRVSKINVASIIGISEEIIASAL